MRMKPRKRAAILIVLALAAAVLTAGMLVLRRPALPDASSALLKAAQGLDEIVIEATFDPDKRTLGVRQTLRLFNRTGQTQNAAVLRTWPNVFQSIDTSPCTADEDWYDRYYPGGFSSGALVMSRAQANDETVLYRYTDEAKTVLAVPVPGGWEDGETVEITLDYGVQIPAMAYRFGMWDGVCALGNAFAIPAVWEDGAFRTDEYAPVGDPFVSDCANYTVSVTVPEGYACVGSGYPSVEPSGSKTVYRFSSPAVRDFALVISDRLHAAQATQDDVLVTAYALTGAQAKEMLRYARKALDVYEARWGEYPYQSYSLAQIHFPHGGMEYPAFSMISSEYEERELEYLVAHETAHQWWYALVGSDGWHQAWQDEALCEFALLEYAGEVYGAGERADLEYARAESAMRLTLPQGVTPGAPLDAFGGMTEYSLAIYSRGAAYLCALNRTLSDGLNHFLRDYASAYAFSRASRADFEQQLRLSTGEDFAALTRDYLDTYILN